MLKSRHGQITLVAGAVVVISALGFVALTAAVPKPAERVGYLAYLNADVQPQVVRVAPDEGTGPITVSSAESGLLGALSGIPSVTLTAAIAELAAPYGDGISVLRSMNASAGTDGTQSAGVTVYFISDEGLLKAGERGSSGVDLWFDPPIVELPADLSPGATWVGEGEVSGVATYKVEGTVEDDTDPECIRTVVATTLAIDGDILDSSTVANTWCLGRGSVRAENLTTGTTFALSDDLTALPLGPSPGAVAPQSLGALPLLSPRVLLPPSLVGDALIMVNSASEDLLSVSTVPDEDGVLAVPWLQHPGGDILGLAGDAESIYVTTTGRVVTGFDRAGRLRWSTATPDVSAGGPVVVGDTVAVALLDGSVVGLSATDGQVRWEWRSGDSIATAPVRTRELIVVADIAGEVTALTADGVIAWSASSGPLPEPVSALADGSVLVADRDGLLTHIDADGLVTWTSTSPESMTSTAESVGSVLAIPTGQGLVGRSTVDGSVVWTASDWPNSTVARVGDSVLVTSGSRVGVVDADGTVSTIAEVSEPDGVPAEELRVVEIAGVPVVVTLNGTVMPVEVPR